MKSLLLLPLILAACGDNLAGSNQGATPDAGGTGTDSGGTSVRAIAAEPPANFGPPPGILSVLDVDKLKMQQDVTSEIVGGDPFIKRLDARIYVINRTENNVTILDAPSPQYFGQLGTGASSNPQDVAVVGDKLYIPALGTAGIVVGKPGG